MAMPYPLPKVWRGAWAGSQCPGSATVSPHRLRHCCPMPHCCLYSRCSNHRRCAIDRHRRCPVSGKNVGNVAAHVPVERGLAGRTVPGFGTRTHNIDVAVRIRSNSISSSPIYRPVEGVPLIGTVAIKFQHKNVSHATAAVCMERCCSRWAGPGRGAVTGHIQALAAYGDGPTCLAPTRSPVKSVPLIGAVGIEL